MARLVPITLTDYWYETISQEEALRRLAGRRHLDPQTRSRIEQQIPQQTQHFLTFLGNAFREYVDFGQGVAHLLLMLPMEKKDNKCVVVVPIHREQGPDGRIRPLFGLDLEEYEFRDSKLIENGLPRETFQHATKPIQLQLDITFVEASGNIPLAGGPDNWCCDSCEWVHSALDIHCADWLCCLGGC